MRRAIVVRGGYPSPVQHERHYTIEEANEMLGWVGEAVVRLRRARDGVLATGRDALWLTASSDGGGTWPGREHAEAAVQFVLTLEQVQERDIVVRDLEGGLVDFPALIDGREVYLCWLLDEPAISHWHAIGGGFAGRRRF